MEQALVTDNISNGSQKKIESFQDAVEEAIKIVATQIDRIHKAIELESKSKRANKLLSKDIADLVKMLERLNEIYQSNDMFKREVKGPGILTKIFGHSIA